MRKFIRENPTIAFGLGLPLLLVVIFLLISGIPTLLVPPPQYDVLYTSNDNYYNNSQNGLHITVVNNSVQVNYLGNLQSYQHPRLWRYNPKTDSVKEVVIQLPPGLKTTDQTSESTTQALIVTPIKVPDLEGVKVDSSSLAPDGYQFNNRESVYSDRFFTGLFYSSRYRERAELTKNGRSIRLPNSDGSYYSNSTRFIGWVVSP